MLLSSLVVRRARQFGACWVGCKLWAELDLGEFWQQALGEKGGAVPWEKDVELPAHCAAQRALHPRKMVSADSHVGAAGQ